METVHKSYLSAFHHRDVLSFGIVTSVLCVGRIAPRSLRVEERKSSVKERGSSVEAVVAILLVCHQAPRGRSVEAEVVWG